MNLQKKSLRYPRIVIKKICSVIGDRGEIYHDLISCISARSASQARSFCRNQVYKRTNAYIDGYNLYYELLEETPYMWLTPMRLVEVLLRKGHEILSVKFT
jgi:hypothetical protein